MRLQVSWGGWGGRGGSHSLPGTNWNQSVRLATEHIYWGEGEPQGHAEKLHMASCITPVLWDNPTDVEGVKQEDGNNT